MATSPLPLVTEYEEYVAVSEGECSYALPYRMTSLPSGCGALPIKNTSQGSPSKHITVVDVYDLAASIGKDFERLVELHGSDCIKLIMPKVISALETLEALANNNEMENEEIRSLQKTVERLEAEQTAKKIDKIKFEEELEQVEDTYRREIAELRGMVNNLLEENRSLSTTVSSLPSPLEMTASIHAHEMESLLELKDASQKQREEIKTLKNDVETYMREMENMQNGIDRLIRQNEELLRKNSSLQKQGRAIVEEKTELLQRLQKTEVANYQLMQLLEEKDRVCKDLADSNGENEPRFTLAELKEVLQEKNILKGKVMELEEEMSHIKRVHGISSQSPDGSQKRFSLSDVKEEDLPVQGPLPREPEEKVDPWNFQRKESGVRRFFFFFKDLSVTSSPRRSSSNLLASPRAVRSATMNTLAISEEA